MKTIRLIWAVWRKELLDGSRDRRAITSLAFSAVVSPLLFGLIFTVNAERRKDAQEMKLPVQGAQYAPALIEWLEQQSGITIVEAPGDPETAVASRREDVVLIIDKDFQKDLARAVPAPVKLVNDSTRARRARFV